MGVEPPPGIFKNVWEPPFVKIPAYALEATYLSLSHKTQQQAASCAGKCACVDQRNLVYDGCVVVHDKEARK